jgi:hypothetical protein
MFRSLRGYEERERPQADNQDLRELREELTRLRERLDERQP